MAIDYVLDPHLSSELPARARRRPQAANAVVCLSKHGVVNESVGFVGMATFGCRLDTAWPESQNAYNCTP